MKKKFSLDELSRCMQILDRVEQNSIWGGLDEHDCMWRCIAYLKSNGEHYTADDAMKLARDYATSKGEEFDEDNYAFRGNRTDYKNLISDYFGSTGYSGAVKQIMIFDPNTTEGFEGEEGYDHTVIIEGYDKNYDIIYFDPQNGQRGIIHRSDLDNESTFTLTVRPQTNNGNSYDGSCLYSIDIEDIEETDDFF